MRRVTTLRELPYQCTAVVVMHMSVMLMKRREEWRRAGIRIIPRVHMMTYVHTDQSGGGVWWWWCEENGNKEAVKTSKEGKRGVREKREE